MIFVSRKLNFQSKKYNIDSKSIEIRFWKDFNFDKLLETVNKIDFSRLYSSQEFNPNDFSEKLTEKLCNALNLIIPLKKFKPRIRCSTPWINAEVKALIRESNFYYNKYNASLNACLTYEDYYNIYFFNEIKLQIRRISTKEIILRN